MRMMMKVSFPVEAGNAAARNGTLGSTIKKIMETMRPEAAYFGEELGQRTGWIFFNMEDSSQIPGFAEPWFLSLNARVSYRPIMNADDLAKAGPAIEKAGKEFGKAQSK